MEIMKSLSSYGGGPLIVRVGGGSTDYQMTVPPKYVWESLNKLHAATGAKFILGLNLEGGDPELSKKQMQAAEENMTAGSILTFEIGNEPNFYTNKNGKSGNDYIGCCFVNDWNTHAIYMSCPDHKNPNDPACRRNQFAGPAWGHVNMYPSTLDWFLKSAGQKWLNLTTVHWYKATRETYNTASTLLDEEPIKKEMANLRELVKISNKWGKPLRVAEMNTISNSGRDGVSNVFAAALWTLDGCFEVAATGAVGVNLHQGAGQNLYTAIVRWYQDEGLGPVILRPAFYAIMLFKQAVRARSRMLPAAVASGPGEGLKVWPLWDEAEKELRIVVINKRANEALDAVLRIAKPGGYGAATVARLVAAGDAPLQAKGGVSIGGITYGLGGKLQGTPAIETVARSSSDGKLAWKIYMSPGSAALVTIKRLW